MSELTESSVVDGRFELQSERGRGGMGTVWRARDRQGGNTVALKVLHDTGTEQLERFLREGVLLARLSHPGIVSYVAHGTTAEGVAYLAMEWLEGENVAERLARQALSLHESLALARATLRALAVAHERGVVHRDVKPSNLFLRQRRANEVVLLDLGLARTLGDSQRLTRSGSVLGTPAYMAPEQAQGKSAITPACDIYSLGCLLFECLTGAPPFAGSQIYALLAKVLFEPAPRLCDVRPELPAALEPLLAAMLEKDPARRPKDAGSALAQLHALGTFAELHAPGVVPLLPRPSRGEQELVSVILGAPLAEMPATEPGHGRPSDSTQRPAFGSDPAADVERLGGEWRRLVDGSLVIVLSERGGAATDLAARAARCALALSERSSCRFVVATGRGIRDQGLCLGEAVERAGTMLRALDEREPAAIWLDEVTAGLLDARFQVTPRTNGLLVFLLSGEDPSVDAARPLLGRPTACVGRERELAMLELTFAACSDDGEARAILVTGPPGIGKSRLRHEFLRGCQRRPAPPTVLVGYGDPLRRSGAGSVLGGAIARWCGLNAGAPDDENRARLAARVGRRLTRDREITIAFIGELCGVAPGPAAAAELRAARQNPSIMADRLTRAWIAWVSAECAAEPVLLVLDDLQWSDAQTVQLVGAALRESDALRFMVLALARPEVLDVFPDVWASRRTTLPLSALPRSATRRLIKQVLGDAVGEDTVQRIVTRAGGNALYLEELIRAADAHREKVPDTVFAMLSARIGLLPARERLVLRTASVFGEHFPALGVRALLDAEQEGADLASLIDELCRQEVLERPAQDPGSGRWRFRHALMCEAAYGLITPDDAAVLHSRAASFLESDGEDPAVIASHAERGGDKSRAIRQYGFAAERAYRNNDLAAVVSLVARAIGCGAQGEELGHLLNIEAPALSYQCDFATAYAASARALELLPPGNPKRIASLAANTFAGIQLGKVMNEQIEELLAVTPAPGALGEYVTALGYAGIGHIVLAHRSFAQRVIARVRELEGELGDDAFAHGHSDYWQMRFLEMLGDDPYATRHHAELAAVYHERAGNRRMLSVTLASLGDCERQLHSRARAEQLMREAVALAREIGEPISWSFVQQYLANLLAASGTDDQLVEAEALAVQAIELAGDGQAYRALALTARSLVAVRRGEHAQAEGHAREAHRLLRAIRLRAYYPQIDAVLIRALLAGGASEAALEVAEAADRELGELAPLGLAEISLRLWIARARRAAGRDAAPGIEIALGHLARRADKILDAAARQHFLAHVDEHVALRELAAELGLRGV
jgi:eukaryotic-like serine/threonine-protein kinase